MANPPNFNELQRRQRLAVDKIANINNLNKNRYNAQASRFFAPPPCYLSNYNIQDFITRYGIPMTQSRNYAVATDAQLADFTLLSPSDVVYQPDWGPGSLYAGIGRSGGGNLPGGCNADDGAICLLKNAPVLGDFQVYIDFFLGDYQSKVQFALINAAPAVACHQALFQCGIWGNSDEEGNPGTVLQQYMSYNYARDAYRGWYATTNFGTDTDVTPDTYYVTSGGFNSLIITKQGPNLNMELNGAATFSVNQCYYPSIKGYPGFVLGPYSELLYYEVTAL